MATPPVPPPSPQPMPTSAGVGASAAPDPAAPHDVQRQATIDELPGTHSEVQLTFWQQPWVQDLLPIVTSIVLHLGIIAVGHPDV